MKQIRWGILGTGAVAREFANGLNQVPNAELLAIGSRSKTTAKDFATQFKIPHAYDSYEALVRDNEVDVVYIATPHVMHKDNCILCLEAGKAVLCEKPFAINATEASTVVKLARQKKLFCMEAMWMRFFPVMEKVRSLINSNAIGDVRMIVASMGFLTHDDQNSRLFDLKLGGGSLLDLGIYPLSFIFEILGKPSSVVSHANKGITGVDEQAAAILGYEKGQLAVLTTSFRTKCINDASIMGTKGQIHIHAPLLRPSRFSITHHPSPVSENNQNAMIKKPFPGISLMRKLKRRLEPYFSLNSGCDNSYSIPYVGTGHQYEAVEVVRCLQTGKRESDLMPLDDTIEIIRIMDQIRAQLDIRYPHENNYDQVGGRD
jgi:predicted dehydrogenase